MAGAAARDSYDVVVIGGGFGGLSAAASLAKLGRSVLLLERSEGPGGCARAFRRGDYVFDPAIHFTAQGQEGGILDVYFKLLGVRDRVEFLPFEHLYGVDLPGLRLMVGGSRESWIEDMARAFPSERQGIADFMDAALRVTREAQQLPPRLDLAGLEEALKEYPLLFKYRMATLQEVIEEFVGDERARVVCGAAWPYLGIPPSKVSFATFASLVDASLAGGPQYCRGGFQSIVDALVVAIESNGGEILAGSPATDITVDDGRVTGVTTESGLHVEAELVVSNADATSTMRDLVGLEHLSPAYVRRLERMRPSLSAAVLFAATTLDVASMGIAHEVFVFPSWDYDEISAGIDRGEPGGVWVSIPTLRDRTLAPEGEHLVIVTGLLPYDIGEPWSAARERVGERLVEHAERLLPGFKDSLTFSELATPESIARWTGNRDGATYGWANTPSQSTPKRLPRVTPVSGLLLAGHWTEPGTGSVRTLYSGAQAAQIAAGLETFPEFLDALAGGT
jgi:prolycopene isomerase